MKRTAGYDLDASIEFRGWAASAAGCVESARGLEARAAVGYASPVTSLRRLCEARVAWLEALCFVLAGLARPRARLDDTAESGQTGGKG